jgi:hypothetical protein
MPAPRKALGIKKQRKGYKSQERITELEKRMPEMNKIHQSFAERFAAAARKLQSVVKELESLEIERDAELTLLVGDDDWNKVFTKSFQPFPESIDEQQEYGDNVDGPSLLDVAQMACEMVERAEGVVGEIPYSAESRPLTTHSSRARSSVSIVGHMKGAANACEMVLLMVSMTRGGFRSKS